MLQSKLGKEHSEFAFLVTATSAPSLCKCFSSSKTLTLEDSVLIWRLKDDSNWSWKVLWRNWSSRNLGKITAQKMKFVSIKDFFSKCDQIRNFLLIWSCFLKKFLMENFIFGAVNFMLLVYWSMLKIGFNLQQIISG